MAPRAGLFLSPAGVTAGFAWVCLCAVTPPAVAADPGDAIPSLPPRQRAAILHRWAEERLDDRSVESRQRAVRDLTTAIALEPDNGEHWLLLGRLHLLGRFDTAARESFARGVQLMPLDPVAWIAYGRAWKREWLRRVDDTARARAEAAFDTACIARPGSSEAWLALVPLRYERGDVAGALEAARRAAAGRPRLPESRIALAYLAYRTGEIESADSLFRGAIPLLPDEFRALMLDAPAWMRELPRPPDRTPAHSALSAPEVPAEEAEDDPEDVGDRASRAATMDTSARFFQRIDPDPTTPENELQLEYWSRVAHAWFVFWDPARPVLDARAETYVRYGPPARVENNPGGVPLAFAPLRLGSRRRHSYLEYPMHVQSWHYPEYGMRVVLNDQSLHGRFTPRVGREFDPLSVPNPGLLAARRDLVAFGDGAAIFPTLPPRAQRLDVEGTLLRFEGPRGPRLVAQVRAAGAPGDTLRGRWIALDRAGRELAGAPLDLGTSACEPAEWRMAEIGADLPPGTASVTVSVRDARRRRGLYRAETDLAPTPPGLGISDVVLCCGDPTLFAAGGVVRFEANLDGVVRGRSPATVYFELYRLATDAGGRSRFEYEYGVRRLRDLGRRPHRDERPVVLSTWREEENVGATRRQFVNVPIDSLVPGRYVLEIRVRDRIGGAEVGAASSSSGASPDYS